MKSLDCQTVQRFTLSGHRAPLVVDSDPESMLDHLTSCGIRGSVFSESAVTEAFNASQGVPRQLNSSRCRH